MKKIHIPLVFLLFLSFMLQAQNIVDSNTNLIEKYFLDNETNFQKIEINKPLKQFNDADIIVVQIGDNNNSNIAINENSTLFISQKGNDNNYEYYSFYSNIENSLRTVQNGSNNEILVFGENNISKNLKINQNASNQTIIITNY